MKHLHLRAKFITINESTLAMYNSNYHLNPTTTNGKTIKMLILVLLTTCNSCIACKWKPVNWTEILVAVNTKPTLKIFKGFNVLYKCEKTRLEKERTKIVALKYSTSDKYSYLKGLGNWK